MSYSSSLAPHRGQYLYPWLIDEWVLKPQRGHRTFLWAGSVLPHQEVFGVVDGQVGYDVGRAAAVEMIATKPADEARFSLNLKVICFGNPTTFWTA